MESEPPSDCSLCPRLVEFRTENRARYGDWFNGAVPSFGDPRAKLLVVGLAPGLRGANRTGRPFTGDYAGDLLYATLAEFGWSTGTYAARADDGLDLKRCMITNAVRCVPPANKPTPQEIKTCLSFLRGRIAALNDLKALLALGRVAHDSVLTAFALRKRDYAFSHGARHDLPSGLTLYDSFHCSRYNTNTRRLTPEMFQSVFAAIDADLGRG